MPRPMDAHGTADRVSIPLVTNMGPVRALLFFVYHWDNFFNWAFDTQILVI